MIHPGIPPEYLNQIVTGDARELAKRLPDHSVGLVWTSPLFKDEDVDGEYWTWFDSWYWEIRRTCQNAMCIILTSSKINELARRYPPDRWLIWGKGISQYSWRFNPIAVYQIHDGYNVNRRIWSDAAGVQSLTNSEKSVKYEDPEELYRMYLRMFADAGIVFDPFVGSGTTCAVARSLGLQYIGFEIDPATAARARDRVANTQTPLFTLEPQQAVMPL